MARIKRMSQSNFINYYHAVVPYDGYVVGLGHVVSMRLEIEYPSVKDKDLILTDIAYTWVLDKRPYHVIRSYGDSIGEKLGKSIVKRVQNFVYINWGKGIEKLNGSNFSYKSWVENLDSSNAQFILETTHKGVTKRYTSSLDEMINFSSPNVKYWFIPHFERGEINEIVSKFVTIAGKVSEFSKPVGGISTALTIGDKYTSFVQDVCKNNLTILKEVKETHATQVNIKAIRIEEEMKLLQKQFVESHIKWQRHLPSTKMVPHLDLTGKPILNRKFSPSQTADINRILETQFYPNATRQATIDAVISTPRPNIPAGREIELQTKALNYQRAGKVVKTAGKLVNYIGLGITAADFSKHYYENYGKFGDDGNEMAFWTSGKSVRLYADAFFGVLAFWCPIISAGYFVGTLIYDLNNPDPTKEQIYSELRQKYIDQHTPLMLGGHLIPGMTVYDYKERNKRWGIPDKQKQYFIGPKRY